MFYVLLFRTSIKRGRQSRRESERQYQWPLIDTIREGKKTGISGCGLVVVAYFQPVAYIDHLQASQYKYHYDVQLPQSKYDSTSITTAVQLPQYKYHHCHSSTTVQVSPLSFIYHSPSMTVQVSPLLFNYHSITTAIQLPQS